MSKQSSIECEAGGNNIVAEILINYYTYQIFNFKFNSKLHYEQNYVYNF